MQKLRQIEQLKQQQAEGKQLQANQVSGLLYICYLYKSTCVVVLLKLCKYVCRHPSITDIQLLHVLLGSYSLCVN